jgi:hypothetical protein
VILFEPSTSEHISARTIDQIPITALSPAADCRTFAIGFVFLLFSSLLNHFPPVPPNCKRKLGHEFAKSMFMMCICRSRHFMDFDNTRVLENLNHHANLD